MSSMLGAYRSGECVYLRKTRAARAPFGRRVNWVRAVLARCLRACVLPLPVPHLTSHGVLSDHLLSLFITNGRFSTIFAMEWIEENSLRMIQAYKKFPICGIQKTIHYYRKAIYNWKEQTEIYTRGLCTSNTRTDRARIARIVRGLRGMWLITEAHWTPRVQRVYSSDLYALLLCFWISEFGSWSIIWCPACHALWFSVQFALHYSKWPCLTTGMVGKVFTNTMVDR